MNIEEQYPEGCIVRCKEEITTDECFMICIDVEGVISFSHGHVYVKMLNHDFTMGYDDFDLFAKHWEIKNS